MKRNFLILVAVIVIVAAYLVFGQQPKPQSSAPEVTTSPTSAHTQIADLFPYQGEEGKDALTLLKEKAKIEQDNSGLVININGRKADSNKREYWAFYVNGKLSEVGPADYQTKSQDEIEWKIEMY